MKMNNAYTEPNGCDMSKPLTDPTKDPNARCNTCKWYLNRCHGKCTPSEYQAEDDRVWTR